MARILIADYGREDFLALGSPLVSLLRAWGHEVIEAADGMDVIQQARTAPPDAVMLYDTLPDLERLRASLYQQGVAPGVPLLILHEPIQHMQFTDMVAVAPQYHLGKRRRQFNVDELRTLLAEAGLQ
jgi:hypothetical protein